MKLKLKPTSSCRPLCLALFSLLCWGSLTQAQVFTSANNDLILGFRKNTPFTENNEVVVNLGQASNYCNLTVGSTIPVNSFTPAQLTNGSFANLNNLSWSVFAAYAGTTYSGYVANTLWVSVPRTNNSMQSITPSRLPYGTQQQVKAKMSSIPSLNGGAGYISQSLAVSNQFNTLTLVRESIASYGTHILSVWLAGSVDATQGTLADTWPPTEPNNGNLEVTTPGAFAGSVRSDLYEVRPLTTGTGTTVVDPHTGSTGDAWYVGYFELFSNGTMTFTRQNATVINPTPTPVALTISRSGNSSLISFPSASGVTYQLYYTNSTGLRSPTLSWPFQATTISGDGTTKTFTDVITGSPRFYRVVEH